MSTTADTIDGGHPITVAVARMEAELDQLIDQRAWSMSDAETRSTLVAVTRTAARVAELELRVAAHADRTEVGQESGATSTASWWAHTTHLTRVEAHRKVRLAQGLDHHEPVRSALAAGLVLPDQAQVITDAVDALPADLVGVEVVAEAEARLLADAGHHDAKALKILGRRILTVTAPEVGEAHEARELEREEARAAAASRFTMSEDGHGLVHGRFTMSSLHGAMLKKALLAYAAPKHQAATHRSLPQRRLSAERMGAAFGEYVERYPTERLPAAGGVAATVVVTMTRESLMGGLTAASLDTGGVISAGQARRLACEAGIIPAVLGGASLVLDLGRRSRFHTEPQRVAMGIEQGGCTVEGCDWPPGLCHAHHEIAWSRGGDTSVKHARLLCPRHHARAHDPTYTTTRQPDGRVSFHRRT